MDINKANYGKHIKQYFDSIDEFFKELINKGNNVDSQELTNLGITHYIKDYVRSTGSEEKLLYFGRGAITIIFNNTVFEQEELQKALINAEKNRQEAEKAVQNLKAQLELKKVISEKVINEKVVNEKESLKKQRIDDDFDNSKDIDTQANIIKCALCNETGHIARKTLDKCSSQGYMLPDKCEKCRALHRLYLTLNEYKKLSGFEHEVYNSWKNKKYMNEKQTQDLKIILNKLKKVLNLMIEKQFKTELMKDFSRRSYEFDQFIRHIKWNDI